MLNPTQVRSIWLSGAGCSSVWCSSRTQGRAHSCCFYLSLWVLLLTLCRWKTLFLILVKSLWSRFLSSNGSFDMFWKQVWSSWLRRMLAGSNCTRDAAVGYMAASKPRFFFTWFRVATFWEVCCRCVLVHMSFRFDISPSNILVCSKSMSCGMQGDTTCCRGAVVRVYFLCLRSSDDLNVFLQVLIRRINGIRVGINSDRVEEHIALIMAMVGSGQSANIVQHYLPKFCWTC